MLAVDVQKRLGDFQLAIKFETAHGVTAIFGPSGSGKSSVVNMIAGLLRPDKGRIAINGEALFDSATGVDRKPQRRGVGYVFQEGRLFPHLNVCANLDYGRWASGLKFDRKRFDGVVDLLGIARLLDRRPATLSGGERQRVAIGRALLMQPRLLLLDEPLASLDAARKADIFPYLERLRDEARVPMIYVSHSPGEIRRIANSVVYLEGGQVRAVGGLDILKAAAADLFA
jgi:molybdate transport system ATP-binding protein